MLTPTQIEERLQGIEADLAARQNDYERAAEQWHRALRDREYRHAIEFMRAGAGKSVTERKEHARQQTWLIGVAEEASYEGLRAAIKVMEVRAMIGMALLKAASRP